MSNTLLDTASAHPLMCQCLGIQQEGSAIWAVRHSRSGGVLNSRSDCMQKFFFRYTLSGQDSEQRFQGNSPWTLSVSAQVKEQNPEATYLYSLPQLECHIGNLKLLRMAQLSLPLSVQTSVRKLSPKAQSALVQHTQNLKYLHLFKDRMLWPATCECKEKSDILKMKGKNLNYCSGKCKSVLRPSHLIVH